MHGEGPGRNLSFQCDSRKLSGGGRRLSESQSLSSSCNDLWTESRKEYGGCGNRGTGGRSYTSARRMSSENSFSQSSNNVLTKRRSASLHRSETRPRKPSTGREGIDDLIGGASYPAESSSFYSSPNLTGMSSPKKNNRVGRNASRSKSPAVIYVDNALNGLNGPCAKEMSMKLLQGDKADARRESWTRSASRNRQTQGRKQQENESSKQRPGISRSHTPSKKEVLPYPEVLQKRAQRDQDLRRIKAEMKLPSRNGRRKSHGENTKPGTRIIERRYSDRDSNVREYMGETRNSTSRRRRSKRVSFSSESDLVLGNVEKVAAESKSKHDISRSLPSSPNTPESPDDWRKYINKSQRESVGLPFDTVDVPTMKSTLPFKSNDECRDIVCSFLSNLPTPTPLVKHKHEKNDKGTRPKYMCKRLPTLLLRAFSHVVTNGQARKRSILHRLLPGLLVAFRSLVCDVRRHHQGRPNETKSRFQPNSVTINYNVQKCSAPLCYGYQLSFRW